MEKNKKLGLWIFLGVMIGLPLILCGGVGLWWFGRNAVAQAKLDEEIEALKAAGLPHDDRSMAQFHSKLTDDFYTAKWIEVTSTVESQEFRDASKELPIFGTVELPSSMGEPWNEQAAVEKFLTKYSGTVEMVHEITKSDTPVRFPIKFESFNTLLENTQAMRSVARLMSLEHELALRTEDAEREYQAIQSMLGGSIAIRGEPIFVSQLVSIAMHGIALNAIQKSVRHGNLSDEQWSMLAKRLEIFDNFDEPLEQSYAGERAMALPMFQDPSALADSMPTGAIGSRPIDALHYLRILKKLEKVEKDDLNFLMSESERIEQNFNAEMENAGFLTKIDTLVTGLTLPAFSTYTGAFARQVMQNRIAKLAIGIRRYQLQQGELPESLDQLAELGMDVSELKGLAGDSFGYRRDEDGAVLWGYDFGALSGRISAGQTVPSEPPSVDPEQGGTTANEMWIWNFGG